MTTEARDAAIRETKRYIREIVRNDWTFEPSTDSGLPARCSPRDPDYEPTEWRRREYDDSGSELEPQSSPTAMRSPVMREPTGYDSSQPSSPVLSPVGGRKERHRRRRRQMEEEMRWNEGLRTWVERRDAWSGARAGTDIRRDGDATEAATGAGDETGPVVANGEEAAFTSGVESRETFSGSTSSQPVNEVGNLTAKTEACLNIADGEQEHSLEQQSQPDRDDHSVELENKRKESTETGITEPDTTHKTTNVTATTPAPAPATAAATAIAASVPESEDPLVPVVPSMISSSNPIRASITPSMYPSIYSKVVIQGLTPTVPINLADVTKAMVQGWKSDGQWPPKTTNIVLADDATVPRIDDAGDKPSSPESKRRSGVANAVRKVLNFSGFHPHPFHRRGSSSHHNHDNDGQHAEGSMNVSQR